MDKEIRDLIREAYQGFNPDLGGGYKRSPYDMGIDWIMLFTPIEDDVWADIRYLGLPMYPQFPIGPYFVDFADPVAKIAVEVDGRQWHLDKKKDAIRQKEIESLGWLVFRIPSSLTYNKKSDFEDENGVLDKGKFSIGCSEGILAKIYADYGYRGRKE